MKVNKILKSALLVFVSITLVMSVLPLGVFAADDYYEEDYELRVLTFEDEGSDNYWSGLIPADQYSDSLLYGSVMNEADAYKWYDKGNTELKHILPFNYGSYSYWGGGHAISNYASSDFEYFGDYMSQLTVLADIDPEVGVVQSGGGNNGSDNFAVHYGYADDSGFNGCENLPSLTFGDGKARVIDHMYVNITTYALNCYLGGNGLTEPLGEDDWVKIIATGYNGNEKTRSVEFCFADMSEEFFVCQWSYWDLSKLGAVTKVEFNMAGSSDNGYGFSQPAYFAYDDVAVRFEKPSVSDIYVWKSETENTYDYCYYVNLPEILSGKAIIALYSGDKLVGMDIQNIINGDNDVYGSAAISEVPDNYKIMLWESLGEMTPLCKPLADDIY